MVGRMRYPKLRAPLQRIIMGLDETGERPTEREFYPPASQRLNSAERSLLTMASSS